MKHKIVFLTVFLLIITIYLVGSVTRSISNTSDNKATFIHNSKGNYWNPSDSNAIQNAIDDLGSQGGIVWVGSDVTLDSTILMKSRVEIDFQGHTATLNSNQPFINFKECMRASLRNAYVIPSNAHSTPIILLESGNNWNTRVRYNLIENVKIIESSPYTTNHDWTGIRLLAEGDSDITFNTFRDISIYGCNNGILLDCTHSGAYINGNHFDDIEIERFVNGILFSGSGDISANIFEDIQLQAPEAGVNYDVPIWGIRDIQGNNNRFLNTIVWDWEVSHNPQKTFSITGEATDTVISTMAGYKFRYPYIDDQGTFTQLQIGAQERPVIIKSDAPPSSYADGQTLVWIDTNDNDRTYLCFFWNGERRLIELS